MPPAVTWGSKFFVASLEGRSSGERIRVLSARAASVAVNCNTVVSVSEFQLQSGGSFREFEIPINSSCSIESTSSVLVAQYAYGRASDVGLGDPFMMIIPPIEQFTNNYVVYTTGHACGLIIIAYAECHVKKISSESGPVSSLRVLRANETTFTVNWIAPAEVNGVLLTYTISVNEEESSSAVTDHYNTVATSFSIHELSKQIVSVLV